MNQDTLAFLRLSESDQKAYLAQLKEQGNTNPNEYQKYSPSNNYSGRVQSI
jgi:hypothetical protein